MSPILRVRLLGEFSLNYDDKPLTTISTPRLQSLLTYLIIHRNAPQARNHLAFCLWPDLPEARARANLRRQSTPITTRLASSRSVFVGGREYNPMADP